MSLLRQRRRFSRALQQRSPFTHRIAYNLYLTPRFLRIIIELSRIGRILGKHAIDSYLNGSLLSLAMGQGGGLPRDIDLIVAFDRPQQDLRDLLQASRYRIVSTYGDKLVLVRNGIKFDLMVFNKQLHQVIFYDGLKRVRVHFKDIPAEGMTSVACRSWLIKGQTPPMAFIWYLLEINCNIPPVQRAKQSRRTLLVSRLLEGHCLGYVVHTETGPQGERIDIVTATAGIKKSRLILAS